GMDASASDAAWRAPAVDHTAREDLSRWRGAAAGRHIVLVSLESTAARYLGLYGADPDVMPNLSELARSAIVFDNAYAVYPESINGLFSILCSAYPAFDSAAASYAPAPCRSLAAVLSRTGYRTGRYRNALRYGDRSLGTLMRGLRARGLDQKTLWIVLGDHGEAFGQHEGNYGHTFHIYDENVHVPFLVAAPGLLPGQIRGRRIVS